MVAFDDIILTWLTITLLVCSISIVSSDEHEIQTIYTVYIVSIWNIRKQFDNSALWLMYENVYMSKNKL